MYILQHLQLFIVQQAILCISYITASFVPHVITSAWQWRTHPAPVSFSVCTTLARQFNEHLPRFTRSNSQRKGDYEANGNGKRTIEISVANLLARDFTFTTEGHNRKDMIAVNRSQRFPKIDWRISKAASPLSDPVPRWSRNSPTHRLLPRKPKPHNSPEENNLLPFFCCIQNIACATAHYCLLRIFRLALSSSKGVKNHGPFKSKAIASRGEGRSEMLQRGLHALQTRVLHRFIIE